jgi:hypothetical protein
VSTWQSLFFFPIFHLLSKFVTGSLDINENVSGGSLTTIAKQCDLNVCVDDKLLFVGETKRGVDLQSAAEEELIATTSSAGLFNLLLLLTPTLYN